MSAYADMHTNWNHSALAMLSVAPAARAFSSSFVGCNTKSTNLSNEKAGLGIVTSKVEEARVCQKATCLPTRFVFARSFGAVVGGRGGEYPGSPITVLLGGECL